MKGQRPGDLTVEIDLRGPLAASLKRHAAKRGKKPVEVTADIVEAVLGDDLVDAVLDDGGD